MSSLNKATLIGNVGKRPEVRTGQNGKEYVTFSIATTEKWKSKDGQKQEKTEWHNILISGEGLVNVVKNYVSKGSKLYLEGKIQTNEYEKDGYKRYSTTINVDGFAGKLILLSSDKNENSNLKGQEGGKPVLEVTSEPELNDQIPF